MRTRPPLGSSRPAISRSTVLLPLPEGPTRTSSSPSAISSETPSTATNPFGNRRLSASSVSDATSPLHGPCGEARHDAPLRGEYDQRDRNGCHNCGRQHLSPGHLVLPAKERDGHRH